MNDDGAPTCEPGTCVACDLTRIFCHMRLCGADVEEVLNVAMECMTFAYPEIDFRAKEVSSEEMDMIQRDLDGETIQ